MSLCFFNSLPKSKYSNLLIVAAFSNKSFTGKTSSLAENSCLPSFPDDKAKSSQFFCLNHIELCFALFCYRLF